MTTPSHRFQRASFAVAGLLLLFSIWATFQVFTGNHATLYAENGLIENLQAGLAAIACFSYLFAACAHTQPTRLILLFCALLCYAYVLRELDAENLPLPAALQFWGHGIGRNLSIGLALAAIVLLAISKLKIYLKEGFAFTKSTSGKLLISGGLCLLLGAAFEELDTLAHHVFFEELAELYGFSLVFLSALHARISGPSLFDH